ncbi:hypothetical protein F542_10670 [Bibersteinia trehalosi USDA-ARS-USMARC-188]|uniref:Uncharacterized protein n=1 Tax=Bibersteinia trehalosi USDA-ARS-USMARC-188 TaxID=1263829 RepID=A0A4V7I9R3_BIBTR|nr:hypothetical protein F542_10670 [Bibersteinia trehalosi USDA-ARS-USMARC-188]
MLKKIDKKLRKGYQKWLILSNFLGSLRYEKNLNNSLIT